MGFLKRKQIRDIVLESLALVADLPANPDASNFTGWQDIHKNVFLSALQDKMNHIPYLENDGSQNDNVYYDIVLSLDILNAWETVKDCIDYVAENQMILNKQNV